MKTLLSLALLAFTQLALAQAPGGAAPTRSLAAVASEGGSPAKGNTTISGTVTDAATQQAVGFATITLSNPATGKAIDGTLADEKGKFSIPRVSAGTYQVIISFIGYETRTLDPITVSDKKEVNLGTIKINSSITALKEVQVQGQRALVEEKVDRTVYNAEDDLSNRGGDAADVLRKVPMLSVDLDGNVSLRGNQNIKVLINNRPSTITAGSVADALRQIPSDMIKSVEVITSPSSKYDAEGSAGIINIILKKNTLQGGTLSINTGVGMRGTNLGLNGSYRKGKMGFSLGGFGRSSYNTPGSFENIQTTTNQEGDQITTRQQADTRSTNMGGRYTFGWDYDINARNYLNASVMYGGFNGNSFQDNLSSRSYENNTLLRTINQNAQTKNNNGNVDANLTFTHLFAKPQEELSIMSQFSQNNRTNNFLNNTYNADYALTGRLKNLNESFNQEATIQVDYQNPIGKNQLLELGAKEIMRQVTSDFLFFTAGPNGPYTRSESARLSNVFNYNQNVAGTYLSYTLTTPKQYSFKVGTRYEYTQINADFKNNEDGKVTIPSYGVLVPSINASKKIKGGNTLKLSYTRRLQRPSLQFLNPAIQIANGNFMASGSSKNITQGNPNLDPEYTHNMELGYSTLIKRTMVNFAAFSRSTNNSIQSIRDVVGLDTIRTTFANIGKENAYGVNLNANVNIGKLMLTGRTDIYYAVLDNNVPDPVYKASNKGFVYNLGAFGSYNLGQGWGLQGFGFYRGRQVQLQGLQGGFGVYSLNIKKDINDKKGSIGFGAENFLSTTMRIRSEQSSPIISQQSTTVLHNLNLRVNFSYRIGKLTSDKAPRKSRKAIHNDDLKGGDSGSPEGAGQAGAPGGAAPGGAAPSGGTPGGSAPGGSRPAALPGGQRPAGAPAAGVAPSQGAPGELSGNWQGKMGNFDISLQLKADGDQLTGTMTMPMGTSPLLDGKITGNAFSYTLEIRGNKVVHTGKIEGDVLTISSGFQGQERVFILTRLK